MNTVSARSPLDPAQAAWLAEHDVPLPPGFVPTADQRRAAFRQQMQQIDTGIDASLITEDSSIRGRNDNAIAVRLYRQRHAEAALPLICFLHGGGWVVGDLDTHASLCSDLAVRTGCQILAVDYRLSPEHVYPAALEDTLDVLVEVVRNPAGYGADASRIALLGDSAGGSLAAAAALSLRHRQPPLAALALLYPALGADTDRASFTENADVPGLSAADMHYYFTSYIGGSRIPDALAAPLTVEDVSGLPPTFIGTGELDALRDDGVDFAERLKAADVPVVLRVEPGLAHAWLWVRATSEAAAAGFSATVGFLVKALCPA